MSCVFCAILEGRAEASVVYEDDRCLALLDLAPVTPGHLLIIPKAHAIGLADLPPTTGAHLFTVGQRLAGVLKADDSARTGINFLLADGQDAGQTVFHVHLHVIPRQANDGFGFRFPPNYPNRPTREALNDHALRLRAQLKFC